MSTHQIDTSLLVTPALRINTKHNTSASCTECTPLLPASRRPAHNRREINFPLLSLLMLLFIGIIVGTYLLVRDNQSIDVKLVFDMVDRIEWDSNDIHLGTDLISTNVHNIYIMQTNGYDCHSNADCVDVVRNMQITASATDNSSLPYNFLIGGDGETYEIRGWSEQCGFSFVPRNSSLTIGVIGSFNKHPPPNEQLTETYALISESLRRHKITENYRIYGVRNRSISATNSEALLTSISKWDHWDSTVNLKL
ncbi:peptidoglycan-recognition protein SC2-like isoform X2 [Bradysia coprophila]|uniref:peptidoglycan-recognition protein SC2-like isoform X2 n=1 Tax=Bradysia coprophila TaxID=38358 RepID=UPI00187DCBB5|nr:peptidoglycan-recognition protein SC2-like isoform X2 [Bradysia coprophila]